MIITMGERRQSARVFVGNLISTVTEVAIKERFGQYGNIIDVAILKGFGFVQFTEDAAAQAAIEMENGAEFMGRLLNVKPAARKGEVPSKNPNQQQQGQVAIVTPTPRRKPIQSA